MINEKYFNLAVVGIVVSLVLYLIGFAGVEKNSVIGMLGGIGFNIALLLSTGFGLQYFQLGTNRDIQAEIFDEGNIAAAVYQGAIWIALALVIAKGIM
jgi:hypothetical protein